MEDLTLYLAETTPDQFADWLIDYTGPSKVHRIDFDDEMGHGFISPYMLRATGPRSADLEGALGRPRKDYEEILHQPIPCLSFEWLPVGKRLRVKISRPAYAEQTARYYSDLLVALEQAWPGTLAPYFAEHGAFGLAANSAAAGGQRERPELHIGEGARPGRPTLYAEKQPDDLGAHLTKSGYQRLGYDPLSGSTFRGPNGLIQVKEFDLTPFTVPPAAPDVFTKAEDERRRAIVAKANELYRTMDDPTWAKVAASDGVATPERTLRKWRKDPRYG